MYNPPMSVRVRFAPSPTGLLHIGNVRTALFNWLFARHSGGTFVLRIEDTDVERSEKRFEEQLQRDLRWLGLIWGRRRGEWEERTGRIARASVSRSMARSPVNCWTQGKPTIASVLRKRFTRLARSNWLPDSLLATPVPAGTSTRPSRPAVSHRGRKPYCGSGWRREASPSRTWSLEICLSTAKRSVIFILLRSDGSAQYNFVVVVDDLLMKITHVIRGEGHISNTHRQMLLYGALGEAPPRFAHLSTILGPDGAKLSKRHGATSLQDFRRQGYLADSMVNYLVLLGWTPEADGLELLDPAQLISQFRIGPSQ